MVLKYTRFSGNVFIFIFSSFVHDLRLFFRFIRLSLILFYSIFFVSFVYAFFHSNSLFMRCDSLFLSASNTRNSNNCVFNLDKRYWRFVFDSNIQYNERTFDVAIFIRFLFIGTIQCIKRIIHFKLHLNK